MIRLGIVGAGSIVEEFINNVALKDLKITVLYSRTYEKAMKFCEKHQIPYTAVSFEEMLEHCDAVYIASQNNSHFNYAYTALNQGKHVLCEKPMCVFGEDTKKLYALADSKNLILVEAQRLWTRSIFPKLKSLLAQKIIGDILSVDISTGSIGQRLDRRIPEYGGGSLLDLGVYTIFAFMYLIGDIEKISAFSIPWKTGVDAYTSLLVQHKNTIGQLNAGFVINTRGDLRICGTEGTINLASKFQFQEEILITKDQQQQKIPCLQIEHDMNLMVQDFVNFIQNNNLSHYQERKIFTLRLSEITDKVRKQIDLRYENLLL